MSFPQIVGTLIEAGFERYSIDFQRSVAIYYMPANDAIELPLSPVMTPIAASFDPTALQAAIKEAQQQVVGYTYRGFCEKAAAAGCAGYIVSFSGRRALYFGRTAETHVEHFPS